jgi:hypothetical protein
MLEPIKLIHHVKLAINPKFENWVLFSNGTYIIVEDETIQDIRDHCEKTMKEFGPVYVGSPAGDFFVTHLNKTVGWVVGGHAYGMYTYVSPDELLSEFGANPTDLEIGIFGRTKRENDAKECRIIFTNN